MFYTGSATYLYGVRKRGGPITQVSELLTQPRGCAYDGDGTVYVADKGQGAVYSFAANMGVMQPTHSLRKVAEFQDAYGVAVFTAQRYKNGINMLTGGASKSAAAPKMGGAYPMMMSSLSMVTAMVAMNLMG